MGWSAHDSERDFDERRQFETPPPALRFKVHAKLMSTLSERVERMNTLWVVIAR